MSIFAPRHCSYNSLTRRISNATSKSLPHSIQRQQHTPKQPSAIRIPNVILRSQYSSTVQRVEEIFIQALVQAGRCSKHAQTTRLSHTSNGLVHRSNGKLFVNPLPPRRRSLSTKFDYNGPTQATGYRVSKDDLRSLVDFYSTISEEDNMRYVPPIPVRQVDLLPTPEDNAENTTMDIEKKVRTLQDLLQDENAPHDYIWNVYRSLPHPLTSHLEPEILNNLLHRLSVVPVKTETTMLRYLTLIEDLRAIDFTLDPSAWTSAIAFVGRCLKAVSSTQVDAALQLWRQMEHEAGVQSTHVTFNVLFDIATKAGKFVMAEMIMKEMERRQLEFNRHFRTGLIYHYGLRRDGNGVRRAYQELVDAGEIVDSVVITCVIKALLTCGEAVAAEQVFERAKRLHYGKLADYQFALAAAASQSNFRSEHGSSPHTDDSQLRPPPTTPTHWRAARALGLTLDGAARSLREAPNPEYHRLVQDSVSLAPTPRTYTSLVYYHAVTAGDIDRATELLHEMQDQGFTLSGQLYLILFKGFSMHGGVAYTGWTRRRLEGTWHEYGTAIDVAGMGWIRGQLEGDGEQLERLLQEPPEIPPVYMSLVAAEYVLRAFGKVAGYERTMQVWSEILARWGGPDVSAQVTVHIEAVLTRLFPDVFDQDLPSSGGDEDDESGMVDEEDLDVRQEFEG